MAPGRAGPASPVAMCFLMNSHPGLAPNQKGRKEGTEEMNHKSKTLLTLIFGVIIGDNSVWAQICRALGLG